MKEKNIGGIENGFLGFFKCCVMKFFLLLY